MIGAVAEHVGAIAHGEGARGVLLHEKDAEAVLAHANEGIEDEVDEPGSEPEGGLVEEEELRPREKGPGDDELLLLAPRELPGRRAVALGEDREHREDLGETRRDGARSARRPPTRR